MKKISPEIVAAVDKYHALSVELSDDLAAHPELSGEEYRSSAKIVELLRGAGYNVEYPYLGFNTAFRGAIENGEGPSVAILVEYDALPGLGHACGHNVHGSMALLAALALKELSDKFRGKVFVFGTPAEEGAGAKVGMAARGALDGMALAVMIHSYSGGVNLPNMEQLSLSCYSVEFRGVSAHAAASPWSGRNALTAARKFLDLLDARRECFTPDIRCSAIVTDGGEAPNVVPDRAELRLEFRSSSAGRQKTLCDAVTKCARGAALALDCEATLSPCFDDFMDMVRVPVLERAVTELFEELGLACSDIPAAEGSSDIGNVSYRCPTIHPMLSICDAPYAMHTEAFAGEVTKPQAHEAIAAGAKIMAALCLRALNDAEFRSAAQASFEESKLKKLS